jgi:CRISPR/Cas system CMR-associated protein Cmr5 small subunit
MKQSIFLAVVMLFSVPVFAEDTNSATADAEAKYTTAIEGRTADILKVLALNDAGKAAKVHDIIIAQYRALNAWHNENDPKLKAAKGDTNAVAEIRASLKTLHDKFLSQLGDNLALEQVEQVKDKMTYGKVQFTYAGYVAQYPSLSEENKLEILALLKQAREEAMDGGSAQEKTAIFQRYKGKINNYLSKQGIHPEKQKTGAETNPAPDKQ